MFEGKTVLITGSSGMIGKELVIMLKERGAIVREADLKTGQDLTSFDACKVLCEGVDYVFHLAGIKGNPKRTAEKPIDFFVPMVMFNTNMLEAARQKGVKRFLYTSSIAVLNPETDKYPAWAKMTGEMQIEAYKVQYPDFRCCIVRPANVYGRFDNFEAEHLMVISDLIKKAMTKPELEVWGNGEQIRDFINAKDVALGMILCMEKMPDVPINLGSGIGHKIKTIAEIITKKLNKPIRFDTSKPTGDKIRIMDISEAKKLGFWPQVSIEDGIKEVIEWRNQL